MLLRRKLPRGYGLVLLFLLAVLVPSVCLLWFMNQVVHNERVAVRQKLMEAYRGQLGLIEERLETYLRQSADDLENQLEKTGGQALFLALVTNNQADAVICFDQSGALVYPRPSVVADTGSTWNDRALAAQLRDSQNAESLSPETAAVSYANIAV